MSDETRSMERKNPQRLDSSRGSEPAAASGIAQNGGTVVLRRSTGYRFDQRVP